MHFIIEKKFLIKN